MHEFESITIPQSVKTISSRVFQGCKHLERVSYLGRRDPGSGTEIFDDCDELLSVSVPLSYQDPDFCGIKLTQGFHEVNWDDNLTTNTLLVRDQCLLVDADPGHSSVINDEDYLLGENTTREVVRNKTKVVMDMTIDVEKLSSFTVIVLIFNSSTTSVNSTELSRITSEVTEVPLDQIFIEVFKSKNDVFTANVFVSVNSKTAQEIVAIIKSEISKKDSCTIGILCRVADVHLQTEELLLEAGNHLTISLFIVVFVCFLTFFFI